MELIGAIQRIIEEQPDIIWSVADISYSDFGEKYTRTIVLAQRYKRFISNNDYDEETYSDIISEVKACIDEKIEQLRSLFSTYGIPNFVPPIAQINESDLVAPFSFKYAAVLAGLGWIGKSGVLVTREFGPRVRLGTILLNYPLLCGKTMTESFCGDCHACIDACPWQAIKGVNWNLTVKREALLDYQLCNRKRCEYIESKGRKHTCGYCILACPWGNEKLIIK